ncbi:hypothetical protein [Candidatus Alkanophaga liquidiphilum]|nr:hypothetical protein [Candidatus Alkanophaga liquidiphilum]
MERQARPIYDARIFWNIERNWYRMAAPSLFFPKIRVPAPRKLNMARYGAFLSETLQEYEMRNAAALGSVEIGTHISPALAYFFLFGTKEHNKAAILLFGGGHAVASLNCLDDFSLELNFSFVYVHERAALKHITGIEELEQRHPKTAEPLKELCVHRPASEGALLVADVQKEVLRNLGVECDTLFTFFSHASALVDKGVVERSSFDVFSRHFDALDAERLGWRSRPYEGMFPELPPLEGVDAKEVFVERLESWFYGGRWYSNFSPLTRADVIFESIGREEIPPTPSESLRAKVRYGAEYEYPATHRTRIIYGEEARRPAVLPPGILIDADVAERMIKEARPRL